MTVIKRDRQSSSTELVTAIESFVELLRTQGEDDACEDLLKASAVLKSAANGSKEQKDAAAAIIEAFEGDHELMAYTHQRAGAQAQWTEAEELSIISARVLNLARRIVK